MAVKREQKNRVNASGTFDIIHYETDASQVLMSDGTTAEKKIATKADLVNGVVPVSQLPNEVKECRIVTDIATRDAITDKFSGLNIYVEDATGDPTVDSGGAYYLWNGSAWIKTGESESMDVVLKWANITDKPTEFTPSTHTHEQADITGLESALSAKQDALTGAEGQVVGFGADGKPVAQDAPSSLPSGGTTGQVLTKKSETDYDAGWEDASSDGLPVSVEILETICENIELTDDNPSYTFPAAITLDADGLYYLYHKYYDANGNLYPSWCGGEFSKPESGDSGLSVTWLDAGSYPVILTSTGITDAMRRANPSIYKSVLTIVKVSSTIIDELKFDAVNQEDYKTTASGMNSHAEGYITIASGMYSHAQGRNTTASGRVSHAEGDGTTASGTNAHAEGYNTIASAINAHAEGYNTIASVGNSHTEGYSTTASNYASHAQGKCNKAMTTGGSVSNTVGDAMVIGNGTSSSALSNAFRVTYAGAVYGLSAFNSTGADYAEFFEWKDLNPDAEDRVGYFATIEGKQIRIANPGDYILGIVSGQPCIIGNADEDWLGRWLHDEFGRFIKEATEDPVIEHHEVEVPVLDEDGNPTGETRMEMQEVETGEVIHGWRYKANPAYDNTQQYIERKDRPEWDCVGMLGVLAVRDDGTCEVNGYCQVADGGIATVAENYAPGATYRVIERVTENVIRVVFR